MQAILAGGEARVLHDDAFDVRELQSFHPEWEIVSSEENGLSRDLDKAVGVEDVCLHRLRPFVLEYNPIGTHLTDKVLGREKRSTRCGEHAHHLPIHYGRTVSPQLNKLQRCPAVK